MMVTVYFVSYVPAILMMQIPGYSEAGQNFKLLLFLVTVTQASDVLQYVVGKLAGRHPIVQDTARYNGRSNFTLQGRDELAGR